MLPQKKTASSRDDRRHQTLRTRRSLRTISRPSVALAAELESLKKAFDGALEVADATREEKEGVEALADTPLTDVVIPPQDAIFFERVEARRRTLKTAQVMRDLGIRTHTIDKLTQDEADHWDRMSEPEDGAANLGKKSLRFGEDASLSDSLPQAADDTESSDEDGYAAFISGRAEAKRLRKAHFLWDRAEFLHENRSTHLNSLYTDFAETRRELQKVQGRMESKLHALFHVLREQSEFCSFLRKGLQQQSKLQLVNVANKGWFRTGHGGIVDLRKVMKPFLEARDALDDREESVRKRATVDTEKEKNDKAARCFPSCAKTTTKPFGLSPAPIPVGGATEKLLPERLRSRLRVGMAFQGVHKRQASQQMEAVKTMRRIGVLRARLEMLRLRGDDGSPLQLALVKSELYDLTADESILDVKDWQELFPALDTSELQGIFKDKEARNLTDPQDITKYAAENNRRFTHIYFKGSLEIDVSPAKKALVNWFYRHIVHDHDTYTEEMSDEDIRSERQERISSMLKEQVETLRDAEEEIQNTFLRARREIPRVIEWLPARFRDLMISEKELLRDIRHRYYRDAARRKGLLRALPDGLSACALQPPPPPREPRESDWTEMTAPPETAPTQETTSTATEGVKKFLPTPTFDSDFEASLEDGQLLYAKDHFDFTAMSDQEFTQAFLSVLDIKASALLTGNANGGAPPDETLSSTNRERLKQLMPPPNTVKMFACKSTLGHQMDKLKGPVASVFEVIPDAPHPGDPQLLLDVGRAHPPTQDFYRLDRQRRRWIQDTRP